MSSRRHIRPTVQRHRWIAGSLALLLVLVCLGVLAIPFLRVPDHAAAAKQDLERALGALQGDDLPEARASLADARQHADAARDAVHGIGGDIWSRIPFLGTPVADARNLVDALDDVTTVAETGVELYPSVAGEDATLFRDEQVSEETLDRAIAGARDMGAHLASAQQSLADVQGSTPVVGDTIDAQRHEAAARVDPAAETFEKLEPMLDVLPALVGFEGERSYLIAMLNPAELRYSGGAALAFAPMYFDDGKLALKRSRTVQNDPALRTEATWKKAGGNRFHVEPGRVANSTFAPSWPISGRELLRAWRATHRKPHDGVIAVDVVAMAKLLGAVGDIEVPGYGRLTQDNLVQTLVGSYDQYYPDPNAQDALNRRIIPAFKDVMFGGGQYVAKARSLAESADGRHFAMYFRDPAVQDGVATVGLDGDLAEPGGDYVGVFTQNINGSKVDYWQRRRVSLAVRLAEDGSATNRLDVVVDNDTPPYPFPAPDPGFGYFTRYAEINLATFLPADISVKQATVRGEPWQPNLRNYEERSFAAKRILLDPASSVEQSLTYRVPEAAAVEESGELLYRLALDPQGTVNPQAVEVTVRMPEGYRVTALPEGWSSNGQSLTYATDALTTQEWEIPMAASS